VVGIGVALAFVTLKALPAFLPTTDPMVQAQPGARPTVSGQAGPDVRQLALAVSSRHLFGDFSKPIVKKAEVVDDKPPPTSRLNIKLAGVFAYTPIERAIAILSVDNGDQTAYRVGSKIIGETTLEEVYPDHIVIKNRGKLEKVDLSTDIKPLPANQVQQSRVQNSGGNRGGAGADPNAPVQLPSSNPKELRDFLARNPAGSAGHYCWRRHHLRQQHSDKQSKAGYPSIAQRRQSSATGCHDTAGWGGSAYHNFSQLVRSQATTLLRQILTRSHTMPRSRFFRSLRSAALFCACWWTIAVHAQDEEKFEMNLKNADIQTLIQTVSLQSGKNFVVDPRVKARVTVISAKPLGADELYETFLSVLQVHGFSAVPQGDLIKIVPDVNAKQGPVPSFETTAAESDQLVTQVIKVENVPAAQH